VQLDSVGDYKSMPAKRHVVIVSDGFVRSRRESWCERQSYSPFEGVTGDVVHFALDRLKALAFTLTDLDCQQLQEVTIAVDRSGAGALGSIE
jgi:hypothetical protein